ncbi:MAG: pirin family protein [Myxococcales bacterium]|nr:pirin family protein [Myxococcales bacterium]
MELVRRSTERGLAEHGWLRSRHTFSFGGYYDPLFMGFGDLRVINEDRVQPGQGFGTHDHRDMEILSYVLDGELEHKDSLGNGSVIRPGDVQRMTAGRGVEHSECNPSSSVPVHFLQIWIFPEAQGLEPGYEQKSFSEETRKNCFRLIASRDGREGSVVVHQNISLYASVLEVGMPLSYAIAANRRIWLQLARGSLIANGHQLSAGDALALHDVELLHVAAESVSELLLFDLRR